MNIAFIGMGIMGLPMAGHLLSAGHRVTVNSRTKAKAESILAKGAHWAETAAEAARSAEVVFLCVTDTPDVEAVLFGKNGIAEVAREGLIVVDHSTISPSATKKFGERLKSKGTLLLDAPVSGGDVGARNAALAIMVGGEKSAFDKVLPLLQCMGKTITHCGPVGAGQLTKAFNQILVSLNNLAACEAVNFAVKSGLNVQTSISAVSAGAAGSWQLANVLPRSLKGDFAPGFMIDLQLKDLYIVQNEAKMMGIHFHALPVVISLFESLSKQGDGRLGTQALYKEVSK